MQRYIDVYDAIYGYFESMLINEGASSWEEYKSKVGYANVGPYDEELWELLVKLDEMRE